MEKPANPRKRSGENVDRGVVFGSDIKPLEQLIELRHRWGQISIPHAEQPVADEREEVKLPQSDVFAFLLDSVLAQFLKHGAAGRIERREHFGRVERRKRRVFLVEDSIDRGFAGAFIAGDNVDLVADQFTERICFDEIGFESFIELGDRFPKIEIPNEIFGCA